jgi:ABC-type multidrug transport system fused ATPase/permease subunit
LLRRLVRYLRPYRWQAALALVCLMASAGLALVNPLLTQRALDVRGCRSATSACFAPSR